MGIGSTERAQFGPVEGQGAAQCKASTPDGGQTSDFLRAARSERKAKRTSNYYCEQLQLILIVMVMFGLVHETSSLQDELHRNLLEEKCDLYSALDPGFYFNYCPLNLCLHSPMTLAGYNSEAQWLVVLLIFLHFYT